MKTAIKYLGLVTTTGIFIVLVMGATVTNTGSEHGCGKSWPLCHGKLIPQFAVSTMIEFSHRAAVGIETMLILALAVGVVYLYPRRLETRILVPLMVGFLFVQAALGAWAVMYPQVSAILALHFGVSLISFASVLLTTIFLFEADGRETLRNRALPIGYRRYVWGLTLYTYLVVYSGAYVRHSKADDACQGWPLCNGSVIPSLAGKVGSAFGHRVGAGLLTLAIVGLVVWSARLRAERPDVYRGSHIALGFVLLQAFAGAIVVWTNTDLFSALAHAGLVGLMFGALTYLCLHTFPLPVRREHTSTVPQVTATAELAGTGR